MPELEELMKQNATLKVKVDTLTEELKETKANTSGQLAQKKSEIDAATAHATKLTEQVKKLEGSLESYKKQERESIEAVAHSIDKKLDVSKMSNSEINAWVSGYNKSAVDAETHSTSNTDIPGAGGSPPGDKPDPVNAYLDA